MNDGNDRRPRMSEPTIERGVSGAERLLAELTHICAWCNRPRVCDPASTGTGTLWICELCADRVTQTDAEYDERDSQA